MTVRPAYLVALALLTAGCGGQDDGPTPGPHQAGQAPASQTPPPPSGLERAPYDLLPASFTVAPGASHLGRCKTATGATTRCAFLHARTDDTSRAARRGLVLSAARAGGWRPTAVLTPPGGSTELTFRRGDLHGHVLLARSGDVAVATVSTRPLSPAPARSPFVAAGLAICRRFDAAAQRIPTSLPRSEGIRRVAAAWQRLVLDFERLAPPPGREASYRRLLTALHAFESTLEPFRPDRVPAAAERVERAGAVVGLRACIPRG